MHVVAAGARTRTSHNWRLGTRQDLPVEPQVLKRLRIRGRQPCSTVRIRQNEESAVGLAASAEAPVFGQAPPSISFMQIMSHPLWTCTLAWQIQAVADILRATIRAKIVFSEEEVAR